MTEQHIFLADTYALIELLKGNADYKPYLKHLLVTTQFNLIELYYSLLKDFGKHIADKYLRLYSEFVVPISNSAIEIGMKFKLLHKKEKLSYVDCIGYTIARITEIPFLTGDSQFEGMENVEFVR